MSPQAEVPKQEPKLIYEGPFAGMLKRLRLVSFTSSVLGVVGFPLTYVFGIPNSTISIAGQVVVVGTALLASLSSTAFLQLVTHPYVTQMHEHIPVASDGQRRFRATKLGYYGNAIVTEFALTDIKSVTVGQHPYATCQIGGDKKAYMYVHAKELADAPLRRLMTSDSPAAPAADPTAHKE
jgi:hypothetical protein